MKKYGDKESAMNIINILKESKMIKKFILICAICAQAFCLTMPEPSAFDKKITFAVFNPNDVLQITAANGYVTVIEFARNEHIINVATGFSDGLGYYR